MKRNEALWTKLVCSECGISFERPIRYLTEKQKKGIAKVYCSRRCKDKGERAAVCTKCGSPNIKRIPPWNRSYCEKCFKEWRRDNRKLWFVCDWCGKRERLNPCYKRIKLFLCKDCRAKSKCNKRTHYFICEYCGVQFISKKKNRIYCSSACAGSHNLSILIGPQLFCVDCGIVLEGNRTHKNLSHPVCNLCMYERKTKYKDKATYGEFWRIAQRARVITMLSILGEEKLNGGKSCLRVYPIWRMVLRRKYELRL